VLCHYVYLIPRCDVSFGMVAEEVISLSVDEVYAPDEPIMIGSVV
jgi:hypothetical protein